LSSKLTPESAKHRAKPAMRTAMMVEFIEEQIAKAPPLSDEQVATIRAAIRQTAQRRA
jgi:hypothetical protein